MRRIQLSFHIYFCSLRFNLFRFFLNWLRYFLHFLLWSHIRRDILWTIPRTLLFFLILGNLIGIFKSILLRLFSISTNYLCFRNIFVLWYQVIFLAQFCNFLFFCLRVSFLQSLKEIIQIFYALLDLLFHGSLLKTRFLWLIRLLLTFTGLSGRYWSIN